LAPRKQNFTNILKKIKNLSLNARCSSIDFLVEQIVHENHKVKTAALKKCKKLVQHRPEKFIKFLSSPTWRIRKEVSELLSDVPVNKLKRSLAKLLTLGNEDEFYWGLKIAGRCGYTEKIEFLLENLENPLVPIESKKAILDYLSIIRPKQAIRSLINLLKNDYWVLREKASHVLLAYGKSILPELINAFTVDNVDIKYWILKILLKIHNETVIEPLIQFLNEDYPFELKRLAIEILVKLKTNKAVLPLLEQLKADNWTLRQIAAEALIEIGPSVTNYIIKFLNTNNEEVKYWLLRILSEIGNESHTEMLCNFLNDRIWFIRSAAAYAIYCVGNKKALPALLNMLNDKNVQVRKNAILALSKVGNKSTIKQLKRFLDDEDEWVRLYAKEAIEKINQRHKN